MFALTPWRLCGFGDFCKKNSNLQRWEALGFFVKLELKRYERNLTISFIKYTPDKLLKMYCCYFLFFLRVSPCVFHVLSLCAD